MKKIYYKEDFPLLLRMVNPTGVPTGVPDFDFSVRLRAGATEFTAARRHGRFIRCRQEDFDLLAIFCDNHGLSPCPELKAEITYFIPDDTMPDGVREVVRSFDTGLCLTATDEKRDADLREEFTVLLPYIKGEAGDIENMTDEQMALLVERVAAEACEYFTEAEISAILTDSLTTIND